MPLLLAGSNCRQGWAGYMGPERPGTVAPGTRLHEAAQRLDHTCVSGGQTANELPAGRHAISLISVISAIIGLFGVLVGAFLSQAFTITQESRAKRLDALAGIVAASGRMIGAYERLFELFESGSSPPLDENRVVQVTSERLSAHTEWREACARVEIILADDRHLRAAVNDFEIPRADATRWARTYFQSGEAFVFAEHADAEHAAWEGMRAARLRLIAAAQQRAAKDSHWLIGPLVPRRRTKE